MPELPEVESFRLRFDRQILHRKITDVHVLDEKVLRDCPPNELESFLKGAVFEKSTRRGKYVFAQRTVGQWLHIHLGMTGDMSLIEPGEALPRFSRVILYFDQGPAMAYTDMRKFGSFYPVRDMEAFLSRHPLGPDGLSLSPEQWISSLRKKKGILKAVLLDQSVVAGLGNLYIDEICLQTGIHPASRVEAIPENRLMDMHQTMMSLFTEAIDIHANQATYPTRSLWSWRKRGYVFPDGRGPVEMVQLAGRTTCIIPDQVRYSG